MKLSVIIITKNEALNLQACLDSVAFANQWIIVDSGSSDATVSIARAAGAQVIQTTDWPGFGMQKNRALDAADGDWVLSLDADERIPEALRDEILAAMANPTHRAYALLRLSSFCGHFIHHAGWHPDYVVRLFQRGAARFSDSLVHERVIVDGNDAEVDQHEGVAKLRTPMTHYSYRDDESVLHKLQQYSTLGACQAFDAGKRCGFGSAVAHAFAAFLRSFIFKRGFLDGAAGLMVAISTAESTYHKYFKLMLLSQAQRSAS